MKRSVAFSILSLLFSLALFGQNAPKYSNEFMNIGVGARSFGLGLSSVSYIDDVTASYWNPAGLNRLEVDYQATLMHASYFAGIANYDYVAFTAPLDSISRLAFSVFRFGVDDIADTRYLFDGSGSLNYDNIRYFSSADYAFLVSYSRRLPVLGGIDLGGNVKVIRRTVGDFGSSWGFGLDVGLQKKVNDWNFGLVGKDIFGTFNSWSYNVAEVEDIYTSTDNELPADGVEVTLPRLILGVSRTFYPGELFTIMGTVDLAMTFDGKRNTLISTELFSVDPYGGVEIGFKQLAFLRMGISQFQQISDYDGSSSWSFQPNMGIGLKLNELTIDYALTDVGNQSAALYSHVFSVKVDFYALSK